MYTGPQKVFCQADQLKPADPPPATLYLIQIQKQKQIQIQIQIQVQIQIQIQIQNIVHRSAESVLPG